MPLPYPSAAAGLVSRCATSWVPPPASLTWLATVLTSPRGPTTEELPAPSAMRAPASWARMTCLMLLGLAPTGHAVQASQVGTFVSCCNLLGITHVNESAVWCGGTLH